MYNKRQQPQPCIERVQALADTSCLALYTFAVYKLTCVVCCHSNETRAPIANPPNSAQLEGTPYHLLKLHPHPCSSVGMRRGTDRQTHTQTAMANIHFTSAMPHVKYNNGLMALINRYKRLLKTARQKFFYNVAQQSAGRRTNFTSPTNYKTSILYPANKYFGHCHSDLNTALSK